jgi:putative addiction module killer protein
VKVAAREIIVYETEDEKRPFLDWLDGLKNADTVARIRARLDRVAEGNLGDHKSVGEGVSELRLQFGKGYRIYFGQHGKAIVVLLVGGDKSSQNRDIRNAQKYWEDFRRRNENG